MKYYKLFFVAASVLMLQHAQAQRTERLQLHLNYSYALPMGDFKDNLISNGSPRGASVDLLYSITPKIAVGATGGFQDFYQKYPRALYQTGKDETTSAVLSNSVQVVPVMAKFQFTPLANAVVQPYVTAGAGFAFVSFDQYLGEFSSTQSSAKFAAQGGAGIAIPFGKYSKSGFTVGANYNYIPYKEFGFKNLDNISFQAGVHFPLK